LPDISNLAIKIDSSGFLTAKGNAEAFVNAQKKAAQESTKYEQELQRLNDTLKRISDTGRYFNSSLDTIVQAQQSVQASMLQMIQSGDTSSESLLKLAYQYNALGQEIQNLSGMQSVMESYDSEMKQLGVETSLFGESLETLQRQQNLAKTAMIQLVSAGISPNSAEVIKLRNTYQELGKTIDTIGKKNTDLSNNFAAFQLITNRLPGPLKGIVSGMTGMVSPATAATSAIIELANSMGKFVSEGYALYQEQEVQIARLGAVLEATGASAWTTVGQLREFDTALQSATGRSTDEIMQMQSVLLGFTSITGENFNRLTEDMIDMSTVMGGSLVASANAFGKAMDTPAESISALSRYGFKFTAEEKNMIKALEDAGRHSEAQVIILQAMERAFKGAAEATHEAKSATENYELAITNLKRAIGEGFKINPSLIWLAEKIQGLADAAQSYNDVIKARAYLEKDDISDTSTKAIIQRLEAKKTIAEYNLTLWQPKEREDEYIAQLAEINARLEEQYAIQKKIANEAANDPLKKMQDLYDNLGEDYKKTNEGSEKEIQRTIALYQRMKTEMKELGDYEIHMIDQIIEMYQEKQKEVKIFLDDWQQLLQSTLGITDQSALEQLSAVEEYTAGFYDRLGGALSYAQIAGEDAAEVYGEFADEIERAMKTLMYSGKFNAADTAIQGLNELLSKIDDLAKAQQKIDLRKILGIDWENELQAFDIYVHNLHDFIVKIDSNLFKTEGFSKNYIDELTRIRDYIDIIDILPEQLLKDKLQQVRAVIDELFSQNITIPENLLEMYKYLKTLVENTDFNKYIADLQKAANLPSMSAEDRVKSDTRDKLKAAGVSNPDDTQIQSAIDAQGTAVISEYERQRDIQEQLLSGQMTLKQYEIERLQIEYGISEEAAKRVYKAQEEAKAFELLRNVLSQLGEGVLTQGISGLIDMAHELGEAFQDGAISADEMSDAFRNYIKNMINALPQLFLQAGLQLLIAGQWIPGLALIGASGLASFVSGLIDTPDKKNNELEELKHIYDQTVKLMDSIREQEEYYLRKRRKLNADWAIESQSVNDMILTPHGNFSTNPNDYIIATKNPSALGSSGTVVNITVHNEAGDVAAATATQTTGPNSTEIAIMIRKIVANDIATGKMDNAFDLMQSRNSGKRVTG
jgi:hypothetical protein